MPTIFHFNLTCEIAIANGSPYFVPSALLRQFESDLAPLMMHFAISNDIVVSPQPPDSWLEEMEQAGFVIPVFRTIDELRSDRSRWANSEIKLVSWGKSPAESQLFRFLGDNNTIWIDEYRNVFERKTAVSFLNQLIQSQTIGEIIGSDIFERIVRSETEIETLLKSTFPLVLKAPLSSSGRGLSVLRHNELNDANRQWIGGILEQQGYLIAERWLNKQLDFSLQFKIEETGEVKCLGPSFFQTNSNGQYSGHELNFSSWNRIPGGESTLTWLANQMQSELQKSPYAQNYSGQLGIDMIVFEDTSGSQKIHPCLEINPRYTMGYLSKQLERAIHPDATGFFRIAFNPKGNMGQFIQQKKKDNPLQMLEGLPRKGCMELTPINSQTKFCSYIELF